jgi:hypothetical protein
MDVAPGAVPLSGVALIDPVIAAGAALIVTVADCVTGPPGPWAVIVKVCVPATRPPMD